MSPLDTLFWTEILVSIALVFQTIEMLSLRKIYSETGIWSWSILQSEFQGLPKICHWFFDKIFAEKPFRFLLFFQLFAAFSLPILPQAFPSFFLLASVFLVNLRWRGSFNGGSDAMTFLVLLTICLGRIAPQDSLLLYAGFWYLGIQCALSYLIAASVKLQNQDWWTGKALSRILQLSAYPIPTAVRKISHSIMFAQILSLLLVAFECSALLALLLPQYCVFFMPLGLIFHLANVYIFGLNRFFFAWLASYPALYFTSVSFSFLFRF
jgi:hypothetical protein